MKRMISKEQRLRRIINEVVDDVISESLQGGKCLCVTLPKSVK